MVKKKNQMIWIILIVGAILIYGKGFAGWAYPWIEGEGGICSSVSSCNALPQFFGCSLSSGALPGGVNYIDCACASGYVESADGSDCVLSDGNGNGECTSDSDCANLPVNWVGSPWCSGGEVWQNKEKWACIGGECIKGSTNKLKQYCDDGCSNGVCIGNGDEEGGTECDDGDWSCLGTIRRSCENGYWENLQDCTVVDTPDSICKVVNNFAYCTLEDECQDEIETNYQCIGDLSKWDKCEDGKWVSQDVLCSNIPDGFCDSSTGKCDYSTSGWCKISGTQCVQITNCKEFNIFTSETACEAGIYLEERWCYDSDLNECVLKTTTPSECYPSNEKSKCEENIIEDIIDITDKKCCKGIGFAGACTDGTNRCSLLPKTSPCLFGSEVALSECVGGVVQDPCSKPNGASCTLIDIAGADDTQPSIECKSGICVDITGVGGRCGTKTEVAEGVTIEPHPTCVELGTVKKGELPVWLSKEYYGLSVLNWIIILIVASFVIPMLRPK